MISQKMQGLVDNNSVIRQMFEEGKRMALEFGEDKVYDFSLGNPNVPAPDKVGQTIENLLKNEDPVMLHGYMPNAGFTDVRDRIASSLNRRFDTSFTADNIMMTVGAAGGLNCALKALINPGDEVLTFAPYFVEYKPFTVAAGHKFVVVPPDTEHFQVNMEELAKAVTEHTQGIILNSPNNPSGAILTEETLNNVAALLTERSAQYGHPIYIIADEPYRELVYDGLKVPFIPSIYANTIICYSWSKSLSLPGERIGYVCVPDCVEDGPELFKAVAGAARLAGHTCAPSLIQRIVGECCPIMPDLEAYDVNRKLLYGTLTEIGYKCVKPDGAFYLTVAAPGGDAFAFAEKCKAKNLLIVPTDPFGLPGYFRLSYCVSKEMIER